MNPLLEGGELPAFDRIEPEHVVPGMRTVLEELDLEIRRLEQGAAPAWDRVVEPLERITDRMASTWGVVTHLLGVRNSDPLREAHETALPQVIELQLRLAQSRPLFEALCRIRQGEDWPALEPAQRRIVETLIRDARLAGVALDPADRERFNALEGELAELGTRFSNQLLDATRAFSLQLREEAEMEGLPPSLREQSAQSAREAGIPEATAATGPWRITLDDACFRPFLQYSRRRDLRERVYRAGVTRASADPLDNAVLIQRILALRREQARLLGYQSFAEVSLSSKMAGDVPSVEQLLEKLRQVSLPAAREDLASIAELARAAGAEEAEALQPWDVPFWSEQLRQERFHYSEEELRPYFPLPRVLDGLFDLARRLFGVEVVSADGEAPVWHADVRFFRVKDAGGADVAAFFLDPYSRPAEKRGGAWMDECVGRSRLLAPGPGAVRLPVAHLVCNQTPPVGAEPSLMSFSEVQTLFHEFGHGLQHMLTTVDHGLAAGIRNVEWDAVELPSQFMENWCHHRGTLLGMARHRKTGESLPEELFEKIRAARTFRAGSQLLRQLHFALTDLELHHRFDPAGQETPFEAQRRIAEITAVVPPIPEDRFLCAFSHIFAGGYAAGYYSYQWAEVLSADAFGAFEEAGLDDPRQVADTGRRFRETVLALGGSRPPGEVFRLFRGRDPDPTALLHQLGLATPAEPREAPLHRDRMR